MVGTLFLVSNATFLLGSVVFVEPILNDPDYLTVIADSRNQLVLGVLLELANAIAYVAMAALMFTLLRHRFEALAVGYVSFRVLEFVMQGLAGLAPLALLSLGEAHALGDIAETSSLEAAGALSLAQRDWAFQMISITFGIGAADLQLHAASSQAGARLPFAMGFAGRRRGPPDGRSRYVRDNEPGLHRRHHACKRGVSWGLVDCHGVPTDS